MKALTLATTTLLAFGLAAPAAAAVLWFGRGFARSCYEAAEAHDGSAHRRSRIAIMRSMSRR